MRPASLLSVYSIGGVLLLLATACCAVEPDERAEVLEKLRTFDAVYSNGLTFRGTLRTASDEHGVFPPITMALEFTAGGAFQGIVLKARDEVAAVTMDDLSRAKGIELAKDGSGFIVDGFPTTTIGVETARAVYFDGAKSEDLQCSARYKRGPNGSLVKSGDIYFGNACPPDVPDLTLQYKKIMWSSGRGISHYIEHITDIGKSTNGLLVIKAKGFESNVNPGVWEMEIEPSANYIVRKARFTNSIGRVSFEFSNEGVRKAEGLLYPVSATWTQYLGNTRSVNEIRYEEAVLLLDKGVLSKAKSFLEDRSKPNTMIIDRMSGKPITMHVDSQGRLVPDDSHGDNEEAVKSFTGSRPKWRSVLLIVNVVAILVLLTIFIIRRRSRVLRG